MKDEAKLVRQEKAALDVLAEIPALKQLKSFAATFRTALLRKRPEEMAEWFAKLDLSDLDSLKNFAAGLRKEWDALLAACSSSYSNGPTEGAVNRLKLIKRQMYGRGSFSLLRKRVLLSP